MSLKDWEAEVLATPGAADRVSKLEDDFRLAVALTRLREEAGLSQRELAMRLGVSQPRVAAIEQARNVTVALLEKYIAALGGELELIVRKGDRRVALTPQRGMSD